MWARGAVCGRIGKVFCVMISSPFRQTEWLATEIIEGALGRFLKYIPTDAQNDIGNCYSLVPTVAFSLHCSSKILLEKSDNLIVGKFFRSCSFLTGERGATPKQGAWGEGIRQEIAGC